MRIVVCDTGPVLHLSEARALDGLTVNPPMRCPRCRHENRAGAKFCEECAEPLARCCASCGGELSATAKFCPECAHPVAVAPPVEARAASPETYTPRHLAEKILTSRASRAALEGERKQVTVLFADLKGSMELLADRDPEESRKILDPVLERMMAAVHRYEGTVNQVMGDGIMARFDAERGEAHDREALALAEPRGMRPLVAHCHFGLGKLYRRTGKRQQAHEHLTTASTMDREMDMRFYLDPAGAERAN